MYGKGIQDTTVQTRPSCEPATRFQNNNNNIQTSQRLRSRFVHDSKLIFDYFVLIFYL